MLQIHWTEMLSTNSVEGLLRSVDIERGVQNILSILYRDEGESANDDYSKYSTEAPREKYLSDVNVIFARLVQEHGNLQAGAVVNIVDCHLAADFGTLGCTKTDL
jgi:hypothetical protein